MREHSKTAEWFSQAASWTVKRYRRRQDAVDAEKAAIQREHPLFNVVHAEKYEDNTPHKLNGGSVAEYLLSSGVVRFCENGAARIHFDQRNPALPNLETLVTSLGFAWGAEKIARALIAEGESRGHKFYARQHAENKGTAEEYWVNVIRFAHIDEGLFDAMTSE